MKQVDFYKTRAWFYCSKYVLLYYSIDGMVQCSTSPQLWYPCNDKNIQCGHYLKANLHRSVAFEFKNLAPQSYRDNHYFSGKPEVMKEWIEKTHGKGTVEWLNIKKNNPMKLDKFTLDYFKDYYKKLFNELVKIKGNPWK
jgi:hypothetical protein